LNKSRIKTNEQIGREILKLQEIESIRAKERQIVSGGDKKSKEFKEKSVSVPGSLTDPPTQIEKPKIETQENGKTVDIIGTKLGISGKTVENTIKAVKLKAELYLALFHVYC